MRRSDSHAALPPDAGVHERLRRVQPARRRLNNFGYCADDSLENNIRDFQQDIGRDAPDGSLDDIFDELEQRYKDCNPPERHPV